MCGSQVGTAMGHMLLTNSSITKLDVGNHPCPEGKRSTELSTSIHLENFSLFVLQVVVNTVVQIVEQTAVHIVSDVGTAMGHMLLTNSSITILDVGDHHPSHDTR